MAASFHADELLRVLREPAHQHHHLQTLLQGFHENAPWSDTQCALRSMHRKVVGVVLVESAFSIESCMTQLSKRERRCQRFWAAALREDCQAKLCFFHVVAAIPLAECTPLIVRGRRSTSILVLFARAPDETHERMMNLRVLNRPVTVGDAVQELHEARGIVAIAPQTVAQLFVPHAVLACLSTSWYSFALPVFGYNHRGAGCQAPRLPERCNVARTSAPQHCHACLAPTHRM